VSDSEVLRLLHDLVAIPSVSGDEGAVCAFLAGWLRDRGLAVRVDDRNLEARVGTGPALLWSSHVDVVPPGAGWSGDPFVPRYTGDRMIGRGCNDAKGCIAAMACALVALHRDPPAHGQVVFAATCEEERGRDGLERFLPSLGPLDAALVGEPTGLQPAVAQNGLLILELTARGKAGHAARPKLAINAVDLAARDVVALHGLVWSPEDPFVGPMTLQVTQIEGGTAHNVVPGECRMVVDVRTVPQIPPDLVVERVRATVRSEVRVRSDRLAPVKTPEGAAILAAILAVLPDAVPFGSPTLSDWAHLKGIPAVKIGPGRSEVSHTVDEWVELPMVERGAAVYEAVARRWCAGLGGAAEGA
jgi:acetylornithine deacetylase